MSRLDGTVAWLVDDAGNPTGYKRSDGTEGGLAQLATDAGGGVIVIAGNVKGSLHGGVQAARASLLAQASQAAQRVDYEDSTQFIESWTNLSAWGATNVAVSGGILYCSTTGTAGANHSFAVGSGKLRMRAPLIVPAAGAGAGLVFVGLSVDTAGSVPISSNGMIGIGISETNQPFYWQRAVNGGTGSAINLGSVLAAGTYYISVYVDELNISLVLTSADGSIERRRTAARSAITGGANALLNLTVWNSDTRLSSGIGIGKLAARLSTATVNPRTGVEGSAPSVVYSADSAGQAIRVSLPQNYDSRRPSPLIIFSHGSSGTETSPIDDALVVATSQALATAGYIVASSYAHANNWGNAASVDDLARLYKYCAANFSISHVGVIAQSMGGLASLNAMVKRKIPVTAWCGVYPACNLANMYGNASYTAAIKTAHGIASDGSDYDAATGGYDPSLSEMSAFIGVDVLAFSSPGDTVVRETENAHMLVANIAGFARSASVTECTGNHGDASHWQPSAVVTFFQSSFAG